MEEVWSTFKGALKVAQDSLPLVIRREEMDWVNDEVREVSRKKQEAWKRWVKSPESERLKGEYQQLKMMSRKCAEKAHEEWWEAKAEEAERLHEAAVKLGHGGSLLRDLRLLRNEQKLRTDMELLVQDGTCLHITADKLERWCEHFAQVSSVSVKVVTSALSSVVEAAPLPTLEQDHRAAMSVVPSEDEVRVALNLMKNR